MIYCYDAKKRSAARRTINEDQHAKGRSIGQGKLGARSCRAPAVHQK